MDGRRRIARIARIAADLSEVKEVMAAVGFSPVKLRRALPPDMCRKLGLDAVENSMMLVELGDGGVFLQPAEPFQCATFPRTPCEAG
jgi:hypothetical protein